MFNNRYAKCFGLCAIIAFSIIFFVSDTDAQGLSGCTLIDGASTNSPTWVIGPIPFLANEFIDIATSVFSGSPTQIVLRINTVIEASASVPGSVTYTFPSSGNYEIDLRVDAGSGTYNVTCLPAPPISPGLLDEEIDDSPQPVFFDERINRFDTGNPVVLYGKPDEADNWRLEVYEADETGFILAIYPEIIASVPECPESKMLIFSDDDSSISLWRLPQSRLTDEGVPVCPFQLNAPSTEAGKTYVIIFDTLYPNTYYESGDVWIGQ